MKLLAISRSRTLMQSSLRRCRWCHKPQTGEYLRQSLEAVIADLLKAKLVIFRGWCSIREFLCTTHCGLVSLFQVLSAMDSWKHESLFVDWIKRQAIARAAVNERTRNLPTFEERHATLRAIHHSLQQLRPFMVGQELELTWLDQLINYVQRLEASEPSRTPEEQFNHLYVLRKWLFWVPIQLLERQTRKGSAMLVLAYFYATALALEPLFPDIGSVFCAATALRPLDQILQQTTLMQAQQGYGPDAMQIGSLMHFPQQAVIGYRERNPWTQADDAVKLEQPQHGTYRDAASFDKDAISYAHVGNLSPAFTPAPLHATPARASLGSHSPFLEVPASQSGGPVHEGYGFSHGTSEWGVAPSPGFPPHGFVAPEEQTYDYGLPHSGFRGGFVPSSTRIWT